jgi:hypothetical protein
MDLQDYLQANIIGQNTTQATCQDWEVMFDTAKQTYNAFEGALNGYIISSTSCCLSYDGPERLILEKFITELDILIRDFIISRAIFFNSLICPPNKEIGLTTISVEQRVISKDPNPTTYPNVGDIDFSVVNVDFTIDYTGKTIYQTSYYTDFMDANERFMCKFRQTISLFSGANITSTEDDIAIPYNGTC